MWLVTFESWSSVTPCSRCGCARSGRGCGVGWWIVFYAGDVHPVVEIQQPNQTTLFVSVRGPLVIGRECDGLLLADPQVSRRHLSLDVADGRVVVTDLGSTNGSTLDGQRLLAAVSLEPGAVVRCGETTIRLDAPVDQTVRAPSAGRQTIVADGGRPDAHARDP